MNLEAPAALWLAFTLPVIVALWLLRPRRTRQRVSSLFLWRSSLAERKSAEPWQRLRNDPLLWLQLLVALLLVAAAVRPFLPAEIEARHTVILLDASGSMRATDIAPSRFASAREEARKLARALGVDRKITLIRVGDAPAVIATASAGNASAIERALIDAEAGFGSADLAAAFALAEGTAPDATEWLLITDGGLEVPAGTRVPDRVTLREHVIAPPQPSGNVAITGLRVRVESERASAQASVRNFGAAPVSGRVVLLADSNVIGAHDFTLAPGAEQQMAWSAWPAGTRGLEARLADVPQPANALAHDDRSWAALPTQADRRVLLVSDGNSFLERLLAVLGGVRASRVAKTGWEAVAASESYDVILLDGLWPGRTPRGNLLVVGPPSAESFTPGRVQFAASHPLIRHVDWSDVNIARAARLDALSGWEAVVRSSGEPLLAVRENGSRRDAVLTFRLDNSDLALRPAFPVLMANLLEWLAPRSAAEALAVSPGAAVRIQPAPLADTVLVLDPSGKAELLAPPWPAAAFHPPTPGLYRIIQKGPSIRHEQLLVASGYTPSEATLAARTLVVAGAHAPQGTNVRMAAWSLWPLIALLLIVAAIAEWWVDARGR